MADMYKILPESDDEQISIEKKNWLEIPGAGTIRCMFVVKVDHRAQTRAAPYQYLHVCAKKKICGSGDQSDQR